MAVKLCFKDVSPGRVWRMRGAPMKDIYFYTNAVKDVFVVAVLVELCRQTRQICASVSLGKIWDLVQVPNYVREPICSHGNKWHVSVGV